MTIRPWSRQDILDLAAGRFVTMYRADWGLASVPAWIVEASLGEVPADATASQAACHPADRRQLLETFYAAQAQPGEAATFTFRTNILDYWTTTTVTIVDLVGHPDVGGVLCASEPGELIDEPDVDLAREGEHDRRGWMLCRFRADGTPLEAEGKVVELTGRTAEEVLALNPLDLFHPDATADVVALWERLTSVGGATATARRCFLHPDGTEVWAECMYLNRLTAEGQGDVLLIAYDITEKRAQELALRESHEEISRLAEERSALAEDFRLLADEVPAAVFRCDPDGSITFHNTRWTELLPGGPLARLQDAIHPADHDRAEQALGRLTGSDGADRVTVEVRAAAGDRMLAVTLRSDGTGTHRRVMGSVADVTATVRLRSEARHDQLTGLLNRKGLEERLMAALAEDPAGTLLVFFDLDGFKGINDTHGHEAGDAVLQELGARLARAVRPTDTVARYGGDEFVLVCSAVVDDGTDEGTTAIVERLQLVLGTPILFAGGVWQPAASMGTARAEPGDNPASLIRRADAAMFEAKRDRYRRGSIERRPY
jgi:diguanylate cyclase (GGDEF)-like protein/PAS domain S-box-containing protein